MKPRNSLAFVALAAALSAGWPAFGNAREIPSEPSSARRHYGGGPKSVRKSRQIRRRKNPLRGLAVPYCGIAVRSHLPLSYDDRRGHNEQRRDAALVEAFDAAQRSAAEVQS